MNTSEPHNTPLARAHRRVRAKMGWYTHTGIYLAVNTMLAVLAWQHGKNWNLFPLLGWGVGVLAHGLAVLTGSRLYDRMLADELRRDAQQ